MLARRSPLVALALVLVGGCPSSDDDGASSSGTDTSADEGGDACGDLTYQGECVGDTLRFCNSGQIVELDCPVLIDPLSTCAEVTPEYGFDCVMPSGENCGFDTLGGLFVAFCDGTAPGCAQVSDGFVCVEDVGPCAAEEIGRCIGDFFVADCVVNQPFVLHCSDHGGICEAEVGCVDIVEGGVCDGQLLQCADGLSCTNGACS